MSTVLVVLGCGLGMLLWEVRRPSRRFVEVPGWLPRAVLLNIAQGVVALLASVTWDRWMPGLALWHVGGQSVTAHALVGYVTLTFVYYWWHRARHEVPFLWRWFHQVHHSATRVELLASFYKHPVEMVANGLLSSLVVFVLLGLEPTPAALAATLTGLAELFYHWNVRTPYWLGFLLQRPESHCVHHQQGHHTSNFSDLPIWDLLFGTFHNPRIAPEDCGFGPDIERRLPDLLLGRRLSVARGEQVMRYWIPAAGLLIVGCVQMAGDLSGNRELRGLGLATHASPAPKVFTSQEGFETFSSRFFIDWTDTAGRDHSLEVTPRSYRGVRGPYNRRNAYGAALSYGPVLDSSERTRPMLRSVMRHAFCGPAPLLRELLVAPEQVRHPLRVRLEPREEGNRAGRWITTFEVTCEEERS